MSCNAWNDQWVARLYDELDPDEERSLSRHLAGCESCRDTLEELERSRTLLRESVPIVPTAPRAVVLRASPVGRPVWAFAAGLAAALAIFAVGAWSGIGTSASSDPAAVEVDTRLAADRTARETLERRIGMLEAELARRSAAQESWPGATRAAQCVTADELAQGLTRLEQRVKYDRLEDVEFLLGEMHAVERRAAGWVDDTREAVRLVALSNDPRLSER